MIAELIARMRSLWSGIFRTQRVDADLQEEFRLHMEMRAADLVRAGMAPVDAAGKARAEFGSSADFVDKARRARGLAWFDELRFSWLDVKLGGRMIYRYPGLTVIGGLAMGVAIALGAGVMGVIALLSDPKIPLDEGERIVGIQVWGTLSNNAERRIAYDLATWKSELQTVRDIGAFRGSNVLRAVGANDGRADPGRAAEMNASGFRVARVNALLGRYLVDADERPAAPLVVVLGYDIWSGRFGADSTIVGRSVKIGGIDHTVVGVMPQGFAWPINHNLWVPLRLDPNILPRQGPPLYVFGRLAPAVSLEAGQAEIATLGDRIAKESPKTHDHLRARILPFAQSWFELDSPETQLMYRAAQIAATLLLVIICVHIAILVYARTATRHGEIAVRSALGASRSRIVAQLVGEALVLAGVGAAVGLALIAVIAAQMNTILIETGANSVIPFWMKIGVSAESVGFLIALAVLAALIIGVVPALQVTGRRVQATLQRLAGGHGSVRMGKLWTSLVIVEVAITVAVLPWSVFITSKTLEAVLTGHGFPAEEILMAELSVNREQNEAGAREEDSLYARRATALRYEVMRRLEADPNVAGVSFSAGIPGSESSGRIEIDSMPVKFLSGSHTDGRTWANWSEDRQIVRLANVDASFFDALAVTPLIGRTFKPSDAAPGANVAVVNRTFVDSIFKGANPIGRKFRELGNPGMGPDPQYRGPWQEIVGVVPNVPAMVDWEDPRGVWYSPTRNVEPATLLIHVRGTGPLSLATRLRAITTEVDMGMFLRRVQTLDEGLWKTHLPMRLVTTALIAVTLSVLILSAAGLYALMSVIVTQRRREIGIRIALGADRRRVLTGIFSRAALQVGAGIAVGLAIAGVVLWVSGSDVVGFNALVIMPAVSLFMLGVGALAALGPARRGLAIQPSVVLKED